ncbi:lipoprotein [Bacillus cereus VDM053]|nr:lipoprotein [Bacillus cereus VDM053]
MLLFLARAKVGRGNIKGYIKDDSEDGMFTFQYKGGDGNTEFKNLEIAINEAFRTMTQTSESHKGARIEMKSSCVSCAPLSKDEPIEVVIKWDDKYEEKMVLKRK